MTDRLMARCDPGNAFCSFDFLRFETMLQMVTREEPAVLRSLRLLERDGYPNAAHLFLAEMAGQGAKVMTTNFDSSLLKLGAPAIAQAKFDELGLAAVPEFDVLTLRGRLLKEQALTEGDLAARREFAMPPTIISSMTSICSNNRSFTYFGGAVTFALGAAFLTLEIQEFVRMIGEGAGPQRSAFLSGFFTLVGCHGIHVAAGLLWLIVMMAQVAAKGFRADVLRRFLCFSLFWHALDIIWVGLFTIVYLMGAR